MRHFHSVKDVPDLPALLDLAARYKAAPRRDAQLGAGKTLGLVFLNPSTRTRISTQLAAKNLGLETIVFNAGSDGWQLEFADGTAMNGTTVEHIREAAPVLGSYFDLLAVRSFPKMESRADDRADLVFQKFVELSGIPVISLESATLHPLQSLADLMTIRELFLEKNRRSRIVLSWAPHVKPLPHCVAHSFAEWVLAWGGADLTIACPDGHALDPFFVGKTPTTTDQNAALDGADFVYVKNWSATEPYGKAICHDQNWMLTPEKLALTNRSRVLHCLPVRRDVELSAAILDGPQSAVTQQAGNRVWAAQAVLSTILKIQAVTSSHRLNSPKS